MFAAITQSEQGDTVTPSMHMYELFADSTATYSASITTPIVIVVIEPRPRLRSRALLDQARASRRLARPVPCQRIPIAARKRSAAEPGRARRVPDQRRRDCQRNRGAR